MSLPLHASVCPQVCEAEGGDEGPGEAGLLEGDGTMGRLRGELRPTFWDVGILAYLLPHLQEPHPAETHHEHWFVTLIK